MTDSVEPRAGMVSSVIGPSPSWSSGAIETSREMSFAHLSSSLSRCQSQRRATPPRCTRTSALRISPTSLIRRPPGAAVPVQASERGHKTDTSETTRATSRDASQPLQQDRQPGTPRLTKAGNRPRPVLIHHPRRSSPPRLESDPVRLATRVEPALDQRTARRRPTSRPMPASRSKYTEQARPTRGSSRSRRPQAPSSRSRFSP
jgi:hypothetical protein